MTMTLAEIKRKANSGNMFLELVERFGKRGTDIPERLQGLREVLGANSVGLILKCASGEETSLDIRSAKLVECDGKTLTVFEPAHRELTDEERNILNQWKNFEQDYYEKNPFGNGAWIYRKKFFKDKGYQYLDGYDVVQGKKYLQHEDKVYDTQVRGEAVLVYNVTFA